MGTRVECERQVSDPVEEVNGNLPNKHDPTGKNRKPLEMQYELSEYLLVRLETYEQSVRFRHLFGSRL